MQLLRMRADIRRLYPQRQMKIQGYIRICPFFYDMISHSCSGQALRFPDKEQIIPGVLNRHLR